MKNQTKQTAMQNLKDKIQDEIGNFSGELNEYQCGYKQCLIDMQNEIDNEFLKMEKEQNNNIAIHIHEGISNTLVYIEDGVVHVKSNNETYGGNK